MTKIRKKARDQGPEVATSIAGEDLEVGIRAATRTDRDLVTADIRKKKRKKTKKSKSHLQKVFSITFPNLFFA
jgi:hypothetical protein